MPPRRYLSQALSGLTIGPMVQLTPEFDLPYPEPTDNVNLWEHIQALAEAVEAAAPLTRPLVRLEQKTAQTGLATGDHVLTFGTGSEAVDTHSFHSESVNTSRVTPDKPGWYRVDVKPIMAFSTTISYISSFVRKNGAVYERTGNLKPTTSNAVNTGGPRLSSMVPANGSSDYFEVGVSFTASANQATNDTAGSQSVMQVEYLGPL